MPCETPNKTDEISKQKNTEINLPKGIPPLTSMYLYISGSCNLACKHCWISPEFKENPENGKFVNPDFIKEAIIQAKPLGLSSVKLTGGEPLLHPKFNKIVDIIDKEKINFTIETNGILINKDIADFLKNREKEPFISVSIDGANEKTHDDLRGVKGSFNLAIKGVRHLTKVGFKPQLICSVHEGNISELEEVVKIAHELGCESVKFNLIQEVGRGSDFKEKFGLSVKKTINLYHYVENTIVPQSNIRVVYDIPIAFYPIRRFLKQNIGKCNILNILGMISTGELSLCGIGTAVPELVYGHMKNNNLREVWLESRGLKQLRDQIPAKLEGICGNCIHKNFCLGTCIANNFFRSGKLTAPYSFCEKAEELNMFPDSRKIYNKG